MHRGSCRRVGGDRDSQCRQAGAEDLTCQPPAATQKLPLQQSELLSHLMGKVAAIWGLSNCC